MVWKPGQSGNPNGRPRYAYHWDGEKIVENDNAELKNYKSAIQRDEYRRASAGLNLDDPIEFQHKAMKEQTLPIGLRVAIAQNIAPYCHPRIGLVSMPRYVETRIDVPNFKTIEEAEDFLLILSRRTGAGELPLDTAGEITAQITAWIHSKRQGQELELKRLNAENSNLDPVIRIEGGLPDLPGTNIIMPTQPGELEAIEAEIAPPIEAKGPAEGAIHQTRSSATLDRTGVSESGVSTS
jgi:hypothetical protein